MDLFTSYFGCYGGLVANDESDDLMADICKKMLGDDNSNHDDQNTEPILLETKQKHGVGKPWKPVLKLRKILEEDKKTRKEFGVEKSPKIARDERNGEREKKIVAPKRKIQVADWNDDQDFNTKLEATRKKLKQDYEKTMPIRHSIVLDIKDIPLKDGGASKKKVQRKIVKIH